MKNEICILITIFETNNEYLEYWKEATKRLEKLGVEYYIINDSPWNDISMFFSEEKIWNNEKNMGKFNSVYNFIKKKNINSPYIKIIDPDDYIDFHEFENVFLPFFRDLDTNYGIIHMPNYRIRANEQNYEKVNYNSFGTTWTILSTSSIRNDNFYKLEMNAKTFIEDQLIGLISFVNNPTTLFIEFNFVVYRTEHGVTNSMHSQSFFEIIHNLEIYWKIVDMAKIMPDYDFPGDLNYIFSKLKQSKDKGIISDSDYKLIFDKLNLYTSDSALRDKIQTKIKEYIEIS